MSWSTLLNAAASHDEARRINHDGYLRRHMPEQVIRKLREDEKPLGQGCASPQRLAARGDRYGRMTADGAKRPKDPERGNTPPEEGRRRSAAGHRHTRGAEPGKLVSPECCRRTGSPRKPSTTSG